jgi:hypothetical protein
MTISPSTLALSFLGESTHLTASVKDQNGQPFNTSVVWSSGDLSVATVSASGDVTAIGNGTATVNAAAGSASATVTVTVQQVATQVTIVSGDGQTGTVGAALASALIAQSSDAGGAAVGNVGVSFAVTLGGGALSTTSVTTGADGRASSSWTLGTVAGTHAITVSIAGATGGAVTFSAEAVAGPAAALAVESGNNQSGAEGFALAAPAVVKLSDEFGNGVAGATVARSSLPPPPQDRTGLPRLFGPWARLRARI